MIGRSVTYPGNSPSGVAPLTRILTDFTPRTAVAVSTSWVTRADRLAAPVPLANFSARSTVATPRATEPIVYFAYSLIRGELVGWYPYPFVDASEIGYDGVAFRAVFLLGGFVLAAAAVVALGNWLSGRRAGDREKLQSAPPVST